MATYYISRFHHHFCQYLFLRFGNSIADNTRQSGTQMQHWSPLHRSSGTSWNVCSHLQGWQEIGSLGLAKLWDVLAWQHSSCWCRERLCCLQTEARVTTTHSPLRILPDRFHTSESASLKRNAMLLEQAQSTKSTEKHGTRRTSCLLCASNRKQALTLEVFLCC